MILNFIEINPNGYLCNFIIFICYKTIQPCTKISFIKFYNYKKSLKK